MEKLILVLLGVFILIGIGLMTIGQQYGMIFILVALFGTLYINHKRTKDIKSK